MSNHLPKRWLVVEHHGIEVEVEPPEGGPTRRVRVGRRASLAVGDEVHLEGEPPKLSRCERQTALYRRGAGGRRAQAVAANLAAVAIVVTRDPPPRVHLIDRTAVAARAAGIEPLIVVNKLDLDGVAEFAGELEALYSPEIEVLRTSGAEGDGVAALAARLLAAGRSALVGPSGVGKSRLTNALVPEAALQVGSLSQATGRGRHTTTRATLHRSAAGLELVDTPGIRDFGLVYVSERELQQHFPGLTPAAGDPLPPCRFRDCRHTGEPGCELARADEAGELKPGRLAAYRYLLQELEPDPPAHGRTG